MHGAIVSRAAALHAKSPERGRASALRSHPGPVCARVLPAPAFRTPPCPGVPAPAFHAPPPGVSAPCPRSACTHVPPAPPPARARFNLPAAPFMHLRAVRPQPGSTRYNRSAVHIRLRAAPARAARRGERIRMAYDKKFWRVRQVQSHLRPPAHHGRAQRHAGFLQRWWRAF